MLRVLIFGTFDNFHPGHRFVLDQARKHGAVTVIVARDSNVLRLKGRAPEQNENERRAVIKCAYPDVTAILGDQDDFLAPVRRHRPELILLGYDQRLPPGVNETDFPCPVERLAAFAPEKYKSSRLRKP